MRRYLLIGNYGVGNVGDEALKECFLRRFPEVEWVVVSAKPMGSSFATSWLRRTQDLRSRPSREALGLNSNSTVEVPRLPFGFRSLFTPWWRTVRAYWRCDGVVLGGGSLFTDAESAAAPLLWWWHVALAVFFRKPVFLAFQGIGPFRTRAGERLARWVARRAAFLSVRDVLSFRRVERWSLHTKCILSFDPVFTLVDAGKTCVCSNKLLIISRKNSSKEFLRRMAEVKEEGYPLPRAPLPVRTGHPPERPAGRAGPGGPLRQERGVSSVRVVEPKSFSELCEAVLSASFLLTQRYHAGVVALAMGIPFEAVPQVPGDKLDALNGEDRDRARLLERVREGEEALRVALLS